MPTDSQQKRAFASLANYVRARHEKLARVFQGCDLWNSLASGMKNARGLTLIIPAKNEVEEMVNSVDAGENLGDTCSFILAHVIRKYCESPSDWASGLVVDMRFPSQKLTATVVGDTVELTSHGETYATLIKDPGFHLQYRSNLAVWIIKKGSMRMIMDSDASQSEIREVMRAARSRMRDAEQPSESRGHKGKSGGYLPSCEHTERARFQVALAAENAFAICAQATNRPPICAHLSYVMSFAEYMHKNYTDIFFQCILPQIRFRHTDLYAIFEPHRELERDEDYLIPDKCISDWFASFKMADIPMDINAFRAQVDQWLTDAKNADMQGMRPAIYSRANDLIAAIDSIRVELNGYTSSIMTIGTALRNMRVTYEHFARDNAIESVQSVFPPILADHYKVSPHLKLVQDEIAYVCEPLFNALWNNFNMQRYIILINMIGTAYHTHDSNVVEYLPLTGMRRYNVLFAMQDTAYFNEIRTFINSTMLLWIPLTSEMSKKYIIQSSPERPRDPAQMEVLYNADEALRLLHERMYANMKAQECAIIKAALSRVTSANATEEIREQVRKIAADLGIQA